MTENEILKIPPTNTTNSTFEKATKVWNILEGSTIAEVLDVIIVLKYYCGSKAKVTREKSS